ncbi:MAG: hypothetical protein WBV28_19415 [Terracidiphilus sp.]
MAARIIYFGPDTCHRLPILSNAGYTIENCTSVEQLHAALTLDQADAVLLTDSGNDVPEAIDFLGSHSALPLILFCDSQSNSPGSGVDLIVPILTPPSLWLAEIQTLLDQSRQPVINPQKLQAEPRPLPRKAVLPQRNTAKIVEIAPALSSQCATCLPAPPDSSPFSARE